MIINPVWQQYRGYCINDCQRNELKKGHKFDKPRIIILTTSNLLVTVFNRKTKTLKLID